LTVIRTNRLPPADREKSNVRAVERAIAVLFSFTRGSPGKTVADLQSELGISRPTLYRLLQTLQRQGLVRGRGEPARYALDHRVLALADAWLAQVDVVRAAEEILSDLWARTDETVGLNIPIHGGARLSIKEIRSKQALSLGLGIGNTAPMTEGASGRAILAFLGPDQIDTALRGLSDAVKREAVRADLENIVERGYSLTISQRITGAVAIAAPIFDHNADAVASLCLFGPEARLTEALRVRYIPLVVNSAAAISTTIGYRGQPRYPMNVIQTREAS
jgi:IclR family transcriptional regulator, acetate operon repressor